MASSWSSSWRGEEAVIAQYVPNLPNTDPSAVSALLVPRLPNNPSSIALVKPSAPRILPYPPRRRLAKPTPAVPASTTGAATIAARSTCATRPRCRGPRPVACTRRRRPLLPTTGIVVIRKPAGGDDSRVLPCRSEVMASQEWRVLGQDLRRAYALPF